MVQAMLCKQSKWQVWGNEILFVATGNEVGIAQLRRRRTIPVVKVAPILGRVILGVGLPQMRL